jgi:predicted nuclease with TOPRIM domain
MTMMQEDVTDMKKKEAANEKLMYEIAQENKRLTEPLTRALREVEELRKQLANYDKVNNIDACLSIDKFAI